jgi:hypothetical protein
MTTPPSTTFRSSRHTIRPPPTPATPILSPYPLPPSVASAASNNRGASAFESAPTPHKIVYSPKLDRTSIDGTISTTSNIASAPSDGIGAGDASEQKRNSISFHSPPSHAQEMTYHDDDDEPMTRGGIRPPVPSSPPSSVLRPSKSPSSETSMRISSRRQSDFTPTAPVPPPAASVPVVSPEPENSSTCSAQATIDVVDDAYSSYSTGTKSSFPPPPPEAPHPFSVAVAPPGALNTTSQTPSQGKDDDWRRHGRAFRAQLVQHDEATGRHDFEMSDDCSIKRYHLVAEKVSCTPQTGENLQWTTKAERLRLSYEKKNNRISPSPENLLVVIAPSLTYNLQMIQVLHQFLETRDDPNVNLRDTYLVGTRLSTFLSSVLPMHKDFHSLDPELSELRRQSHARWLSLTHYLEELALIIDEEEHNQFVLRDLNDSDDTNEDDAPTDRRNRSVLQESLPPNMVITSPKKKSAKRREQTSSFPTEDHANHSMHDTHQHSAMPCDASMQQRPLLNPCQYPAIDPMRRTTTDYQSFPTADGPNSDQHVLAGEDPWKLVDGATVASLDTQWFSSAAFSDPFPPSTEHNNYDVNSAIHQQQTNKHVHAPTEEADEEIMHMKGTSASRVEDETNIQFGHLSLEEAKTFGYFGDSSPIQSVAAPVAATPREEDDARKLSWKIAPSPSSKAPKTPSPLSKDTYKDQWGSSPFHDPGHISTKMHASSSDNQNKISWNPEPTWDDAIPHPVMDMTSLWDTTPEKEDGRNVIQEDVEAERQHSKVKPLRRQSSRYMALEEHKQHQARQRQRESKDRESEEDHWPLRRDLDSDADFARMSDVLQRNKAQKYDAYRGQPALRQRGVHHLKECVRCLLD